jgi:hypothetical protein
MVVVVREVDSEKYPKCFSNRDSREREKDSDSYFHPSDWTTQNSLSPASRDERDSRTKQRMSTKYCELSDAPVNPF